MNLQQGKMENYGTRGKRNHCMALGESRTINRGPVREMSSRILNNPVPCNTKASGVAILGYGMAVEQGGGGELISSSAY